MQQLSTDFWPHPAARCVSETSWLIFVKDEAADGVSGCT